MEGHHAIAHGVGADSRLATDEAQPGGGSKTSPSTARSRHPCGTARRYVPNVTARCRRQATARRCGDGSSAAADEAQPGGMCQMRQQDAADEAPPRGVR